MMGVKPVRNGAAKGLANIRSRYLATLGSVTRGVSCFASIRMRRRVFRNGSPVDGARSFGFSALPTFFDIGPVVLAGPCTFTRTAPIDVAGFAFVTAGREEGFRAREIAHSARSDDRNGIGGNKKAPKKRGFISFLFAHGVLISSPCFSRLAGFSLVLRNLEDTSDAT
jgi:hypothetical protein